MVFYGGRLGLVNLDGCSLDDYRRDIAKLADLNVDSLMPGHGVFMNGMMVQQDNHNFAFAWNCVNWLGCVRSVKLTTVDSGTVSPAPVLM